MLNSRPFATATLLLVLAACASRTGGAPGSTGSSLVADPARPHLAVEAWMEPMRNDEGSEIYIRNRSRVPIIVTQVDLTNCISLAERCGAHYPRTRIAAGTAERVLRVRYQPRATYATVPSYQFSFSVEPDRQS